jgi:hypothetical protein
MLASVFANVLGWKVSGIHIPGPIGRRVNAVLVALSRRACIHPIYTIGFFAILASTTYLTLIESPLFNRGDLAFDSLGKIDFNYMLKGSKQLYAGPQSDWKWSVEAPDIKTDDVSSSPFALLHSVTKAHAWHPETLACHPRFPRVCAWCLQRCTTTELHYTSTKLICKISASLVEQTLADFK